jgi:hypothetical protein
MGRKLLFVLGIVIAHGALGAVWVQQEATEHHPALPTCVYAPGPLPYIQPQRELLAMRVEAITVGDAMQP